MNELARFILALILAAAAWAYLAPLWALLLTLLIIVVVFGVG